MLARGSRRKGATVKQTASEGELGMDRPATQVTPEGKQLAALKEEQGRSRACCCTGDHCPRLAESWEQGSLADHAGISKHELA